MRARQLERARLRSMGASSSRDAWHDTRGQQLRSRCCHCFEQPGYYGVGPRTRSAESPRRRRRRRRQRSFSVGSAESNDEALESRGRTRQRRGSDPKWKVVLEILRPDGGYTRLEHFILSPVRQYYSASCRCHVLPLTMRCARPAVWVRRVSRTPSVVLLGAPLRSMLTFVGHRVRTAFSP